MIGQSCLKNVILVTGGDRCDPDPDKFDIASWINVIGWPIRGFVITLNQREANVQVTWSLLTNHMICILSSDWSRLIPRHWCGPVVASSLTQTECHGTLSCCWSIWIKTQATFKTQAGRGAIFCLKISKYKYFLLKKKHIFRSWPSQCKLSTPICSYSTSKKLRRAQKRSRPHSF